MRNRFYDEDRLMLELEEVERSEKTKRDSSECLEILSSVLELCGSFSESHKNARKIALAILRGRTKIIAPVCPEYDHENGRYDFRVTGDSVLTISETYIEFLKDMKEFIPKISMELLILDHEADGPELSLVRGKSYDHFLSLAYKSVGVVSEIAPPSVSVGPMTEMVPNFLKLKAQAFRRIHGKASFRKQVMDYTDANKQKYRRISRNMSRDEMLQRTAHEFSRYLALGEYAALKGYFVYDQGMATLPLYDKTDAPVLHHLGYFEDCV